MDKERREFLKTAGVGLVGMALAGAEIEDRIKTAEGNVELTERLKEVDATIKVAMRDGMDANIVLHVLLGRKISHKGYKQMLDDAVEAVKEGADAFEENFWMDLAVKKGIMPAPTPTPTPDPTPSGLRAKVDMARG